MSMQGPRVNFCAGTNLLNRRKLSRFNGQNNEDERAPCISAVYKPMNQRVFKWLLRMTRFVTERFVSHKKHPWHVVARILSMLWVFATVHVLAVSSEVPTFRIVTFYPARTFQTQYSSSLCSQFYANFNSELYAVWTCLDSMHTQVMKLWCFLSKSGPQPPGSTRTSLLLRRIDRPTCSHWEHTGRQAFFPLSHFKMRKAPAITCSCTWLLSPSSSHSHSSVTHQTVFVHVPPVIFLAPWLDGYRMLQGNWSIMLKVQQCPTGCRG